MSHDILQRAIKMSIKLTETAHAAELTRQILACWRSPLAASEHMMNGVTAAQTSAKTNKSLQGREKESHTFL